MALPCSKLRIAEVLEADSLSAVPTPVGMIAVGDADEKYLVLTKRQCLWLVTEVATAYVSTRRWLVRVARTRSISSLRKDGVCGW